MVSALVDAIVLFFAFVVAPRWIIAAWRLDMFSADNEPTIFDRKHRKVYRPFTPLDGSSRKWSQIFKPFRLQLAQYDWNQMSAEYRIELVTSGKKVSRIHRLVMIVKDGGRPVEEFNVGNSMAMGPNSVPMLWEHLRRFMEEDGPGVPEGEPLQVFERPKNRWQSMGVVSPFGPKFMWWWNAGRFPVIVMLIAFPFTLPFFTVWAICNWISHMTMRKTIWPDEIHERIGQPVRSAEDSALR